MKKTLVTKPHKTAVIEAIRVSLRLQQSQAKPNRFAAHMKDAPLVAVIDPDVAKVFTTPEAVNTVLRALISAMPKERTIGK